MFLDDSIGRSSYLFGREFYTGSKREFILVWRRVLYRFKGRSSYLFGREFYTGSKRENSPPNKYELLSLNLYKTLLQTSMNPYLRTCVKLSSKQV
jgi:hypothetical protein